jgi:hypothetical protein
MKRTTLLPIALFFSLSSFVSIEQELSKQVATYFNLKDAVVVIKNVTLTYTQTVFESFTDGEVIPSGGTVQHFHHIC